MFSYLLNYSTEAAYFAKKIEETSRCIKKCAKERIEMKIARWRAVLRLSAGGDFLDKGNEFVQFPVCHKRVEQSEF